VYWIGGSPCAGKSSIARLLAARHGLLHFECDARVPSPPDPPELPTCERLARPPEWQAAREVEFYRGRFDFLLASLPPSLSSEERVLVEGADLLPDLLDARGVPMNNAIWIVPTPDFQLRYYAARDWVAEYVAECADPAQAFANWMRRDMLFADHVRAQAAVVGGRVVVVDGTRSIEQNARLVEHHFGLVNP
jgi:2-phosphoglycerate kinase